MKSGEQNGKATGARSKENMVKKKKKMNKKKRQWQERDRVMQPEKEKRTQTTQRIKNKDEK